MEAAYEFALNGPNIEFALYRIREGHPIPAGLFIDIMTEKCQLINKHLHNTHDLLDDNGQYNQHISLSTIPQYII